MGKSENKKSVFLSHASTDKEDLINPFVKSLRKNGISYWLDSAEISWGESITKNVNKGLINSDYVIVFLSKNFIGRNWTETELMAALNLENSEGRSIVLPIIIGNANEILLNYPLLRDKSYMNWDQGIEFIIKELKKLIGNEEEVNLISVNVLGTNHSVLVNLKLAITFLEKMYHHNVYYPEYVKKELNQSGFLVEILKDDSEIDIHGIKIKKMEPKLWGVDGIYAFAIARVLLKLVTGNTVQSRYYAGVGYNYRQIIEDLKQHV
jgi:hypothetical protein